MAGSKSEHQDTPARYEFVIDGEVSADLAAAFPELQSARGPAGGTVMFGVITDQSHLHGLLARFQNFNLSVVEFRRLPD